MRLRNIAWGTCGIYGVLFLDSDAGAYRIASAGIPLMATGFVFYIVNVTIIGYFQSVERVLPATTYSLARGLVFLVPTFILMPHLASPPRLGSHDLRPDRRSPSDGNYRIKMIKVHFLSLELVIHSTLRSGYFRFGNSHIL